MTRNTFKTKNQLKVSTYIYVTILILLLLAAYLIIGNARLFAAAVNLDHHEETNQALDEIRARDPEEQQQRFSEETRRQKADAAVAAVLLQEAEDGVSGTTTIGRSVIGMMGSAVTLESQMNVMQQPWITIQAGDDISALGLLVVSVDSLSTSEINWLCNQVDKGLNILFTDIPANPTARLLKLMGITDMGAYTTYPGMRTSSELLDGIRWEETDKEVEAWELKLKKNAAVYACALPRGYASMDNEDLPPLVWRYVSGEGAGSVYVCNGNFMANATACKILPSILAEIDGFCIYPVINAFCVFVDGAPYATNVNNSTLQNLYSRDLLGIQRDLLMPELVRCATLYGGNFTFFTEDYDEILTSTDTALSYYRNEITSLSSTLAIRTADGELQLTDRGECFQIRDWSSEFSFWDSATKRYCLLVNTTLPDTEEFNRFELSGTIGGMGIFCIRLDINELLAYDGNISIWDSYWENLETLLGTIKRDYDWVDRVDVNEAMRRLYVALNVDMDVTYRTDGMDMSLSYPGDTCYFMLKTSRDDVRVTGGTVESVGYGCYLVTANTDQVSIFWK